MRPSIQYFDEGAVPELHDLGIDPTFKAETFESEPVLAALGAGASNTIGEGN